VFLLSISARDFGDFGECFPNVAAFAMNAFADELLELFVSDEGDFEYLEDFRRNAGFKNS
jgi:hypothetical protein